MENTEDVNTSFGSNEELPEYGTYAMVLENYTNMTLTIRTFNNLRVQLQVADIDTVAAVKRRLCQVLDNMHQVETIELRFKNSLIKLENSESLAQLGIKDGTELVLDLHKLAAANPQTGKWGNSVTVILEDDDKLENYEDSDDEQPPPEYSMIDHMLRDFRSVTEIRPQQYCGRLRFCILLTLAVIVTIILPISLIVIGSMSLDRCPAKTNIPVWMIAFGVLIIVQALIVRTSTRIKHRIKSEMRVQPEYEVMPRARLQQCVSLDYSKRYRRLDQFDQLIKTCIFVWFVIGSVWVFGCSHCKDAFDPVLQIGCDGITFHSAMVIMIFLYVLLALPFLSVMCKSPSSYSRIEEAD